MSEKWKKVVIYTICTIVILLAFYLLHEPG